MTNSVLYEAPGPAAKRRSLLLSVAVGVVLAAVLAWVLYTLGANDQLTVDKWGPLIDPTDGTFAPLWTLMGVGLGNTLLTAVLAMAFSLLVGTLLAVSRIVAARWYRWAVVGVVELLRGVPVVIAVFFASRVLPSFGLDMSVMWYLVIGLTAYNSVIIAEIVRAGIQSLPRGQGEAAYAIGMRRSQVLRTVLLPQAFRAMLPALISQLVVIVKDTSLGFIISYVDVVRQGQIVIQNLNNPIQTYFVIGVLFVVLNYALSRAAVYTERRLSQGRKGGGTAARAAQAQAAE
ncbi:MULTISPECIES: amino acid ABC transporter permease [Saccharopolyspora]|uniref:Amino acid ABC transporter permease n=1 Tax=Saccharopolyspora gregorii TaxID=33914 RepID=A0ABP6RU88_9PSEU|nr:MULTISPECIES: amino acid ABC transporter permease [Saccharopolyspora]MCA1186057.1 amino acid ABC transporter permease [Saccharopolyspora sp. 6T]MCA1192448.1 amino acid ABC transporter permease [Saccharopolyspora sp. 6V]MCA1224512.1 amino acid ABC transporter permease [Saccharopolyspora sp. 6M]MCA1282244.1 amino acid ABC transporter permease [Saccharopolyspora sp. 7B]